MKIEIIIDSQPTVILFHKIRDVYRLEENFPHFLPILDFVVYARQIMKPFQIHRNGNILKGRPGDWIMKKGGEYFLSKKRAFNKAFVRL